MRFAVPGRWIRFDPEQVVARQLRIDPRECRIGLHRNREHRSAGDRRDGIESAAGFDAVRDRRIRGTGHRLGPAQIRQALPSGGASAARRRRLRQIRTEIGVLRRSPDVVDSRGQLQRVDNRSRFSGEALDLLDQRLAAVRSRDRETLGDQDDGLGCFDRFQLDEQLAQGPQGGLRTQAALPDDRRQRALHTLVIGRERHAGAEPKPDATTDRRSDGWSPSMNPSIAARCAFIPSKRMFARSTSSMMNRPGAAARRSTRTAPAPSTDGCRGLRTMTPPEQAGSIRR